MDCDNIKIAYCNKRKKQQKMQDSLFYINRQLISNNPNQKILQTYNSVTLEDNSIKVIDLTMKVTTHRILLYSNNDHAFLVEGSKIKEALISESGILWNKEYFLKLHTEYGKLKFQMNNYKQAHVTISAMIKNQEWTKPSATATASNNPQMYSGIFSKIDKEKKKIQVSANKVSESFVSFESLFSNLRQIKDAMKELKSISGDGEGENSEVKQILKDIGFVSGVDKQSAGRDYIRELSKELFSICNGTLFKKYGGIVSLLDLFYFYNMKRQMQLISPEELLEACEQFEKFGLAAKVVKYPNNIKMVESTQFDEKQDFQMQFNEFFKDYQKGYSAEEISRKKNLPLAIIEIKLKKACRRGVIVVDSRIEGVKYFKNLFLTVS